MRRHVFLFNIALWQKEHVLYYIYIYLYIFISGKPMKENIYIINNGFFVSTNINWCIYNDTFCFQILLPGNRNIYLYTTIYIYIYVSTRYNPCKKIYTWEIMGFLFVLNIKYINWCIYDNRFLYRKLFRVNRNIKTYAYLHILIHVRSFMHNGRSSSGW